jgi:hypothetical protein
MAVEIKETTEKAVETTDSNVVMGADLVTGAAVTVAENVSRAISHPVREAGKIERRGAAANRQLSRDVAGLVEETGDAIDAIMPEKVALLGIHAIKDRARRKDLLGDVAYRTLEIVNGGLEAVVGTLNRLERATQPPTRTGSGHTRPQAARKTSRKAKRTVGRAVSGARSSGRRGTASARRTEKRS